MSNDESPGCVVFNVEDVAKKFLNHDVEKFNKEIAEEFLDRFKSFDSAEEIDVVEIFGEGFKSGAAYVYKRFLELVEEERKSSKKIPPRLFRKLEKKMKKNDKKSNN
jgi:hypothetical protein